MTGIMRETADFITCCVCLTHYDENLKKPKFLNCSHTACLQCLQVIWKEGTVVCPLCRKKSTCNGGAAKLANNLHALHMIKLQQTITAKAKQKREPAWCFTCASLAKSSCSGSHITAAIPLEKFTEDYELQQLASNSKANLEAVIQKRLDIGADLGQLMEDLKDVQGTIQNLKNDNEKYLTAAMERLEKFDRVGKHVAASLKEEMKKSIADSDRELKELEKSSQNRQAETKFRIKILLENDGTKTPTISYFDDGFIRTDWDQPGRSARLRELRLISHLVFSAIRRRNVHLDFQ